MYDKSKKTWSQRLKITKTEKINPPLVVPPLQTAPLQLNERTGHVEFASSPIPRPVEYINPWMYGTVRGVPAHPVAFHPCQAVFAPIPSDIAVVICSCPDYLHGTKKDVKKATICKKCKGSRLPLAPIGGTVRMRPTSLLQQQKAHPTSATTLRVMSPKSRPSILDTHRGSHDLARPPWLGLPEAKSSPQLQEKIFRSNRSKSTSPTRARNSTPKSQFQGLTAQKAVNTGQWRPEHSKEPPQETNLRRSILNCNVNPYDLISTQPSSASPKSPQSISEFLSHPNDKGGKKTQQNITPKTINSKQEKSASPKVNTSDNSPSSVRPNSSKSSIRNNVVNYPNVKAIAGQRISLGDTKKTFKPPNEEEFIYEDITSNKDIPDNTVQSPKQPDNTKIIEPFPSADAVLATPRRPPRQKNDVISVKEGHTRMSLQFSTDSLSPGSQNLSIKSILKRPPSGQDSCCSPTSSNSQSPDSSPSSGKPFTFPIQKSQHYSSNNQIMKDSNITPETSSKIAASSADGLTKTNDNKKLTKINGGQKPPNETKTGSQFYIPLPQTRKKVQFMVENKIIHVDNTQYTDGIMNNNNYIGNEHEHEHDDNDEDDFKSAQEDNDSNESETHKNSTTNKCNRDSKTITKNPSSKSTNVTDINGDKQQDRTSNSSRTSSSESKTSSNYGTIDAKESGQTCKPHQVKIDDKPLSLQQKRQLEILKMLQHDSNLVRNQMLNKVSNYCRPSPEPERNYGRNDDGDDKESHNSPYVGNTNTKDITPCTPKPSKKVILKKNTTSGQSRNPIRRTCSERHPNKNNVDTSSASAAINFKDTMALRVKVGRKDSRGIFARDGTTMQHNIGLFRPKEPPPPPPPPPPLPAPPTASFTSPQSSGDTAEVYQRHQLLNNIVLEKKAKEDQPTFADDGNSGKSQTILITTTKDSGSKNYSGSDRSWSNSDSNFTPGHILVSTRNHNLSVNNAGLKEPQKPPLITGADQKESTTITDNSKRNGSPCQDKNKTNIYDNSEALSPVAIDAQPAKSSFANTTTSNRTVVRVAPFNKTTSEVHRLKITHTDNDDKIFNRRSTANATNGQKKTSILINGDDCYSTVNVSNDTPLYQSSVVVADGSAIEPLLKVTSNTVTINVVSTNSKTAEEKLTYKNNQINSMLNRSSTRAVIPILGTNSCDEIPNVTPSHLLKTTPKRGRTLITFDYDKSQEPLVKPAIDTKDVKSPEEVLVNPEDELFSHEEELVKILRNPVEAVRRNLVPHVCGKAEASILPNHPSQTSIERKSPNRLRSRHKNIENPVSCTTADISKRNSFVAKLLEDPTLAQLAEGLDSDVVIKLIESSLKRLKESRGDHTTDNESMNRLINVSLQRLKEERQKMDIRNMDDQQDMQSNRGSISSGNSFSSANYEMFDFSDNNESDCYQSCSSEITQEIEAPQETRNKFYQMLVDATLAEIEISTSNEEEHHYESIPGIGGCNNGDPIYEEITDIPPPLPLSPPPVNDAESEKKIARSMFEGASKYDILSYLVDAKERGLVKEESIDSNGSTITNPMIIEEENDTLSDLKQISDTRGNDSSEDNSSLGSLTLGSLRKGSSSSEIERNDSGVGSETSKSSRSKYQNHPQTGTVLSKISPIHLCEDCDGPVETQHTESGVMFAPLVCRKCGKKRAERKEIITEIVETEEKYGRDLQIILEEFCQPMLVAGLLTQEQLSAIFLNTEELLENNQTLAERMRDALDISLEQGDDDLLTVNIGKILLDFTQMLHAFEIYCVRQAGASLLLANLEKEKELLRIFLKVSQMENAMLRRMNLNSFLMVPVQRVTKYPLLLARLYKVTPLHLEGRDLIKQAQEKIELHLTHINQEAKDVPTKLWRRISSSSPNRRASCEIDMINIKLRKMAIDILDWNHDEVRFAMEGKLLYTQPTDSNWKKGRTIKLNLVNALLVTNGKPSSNYKAEKVVTDQLNFPKHNGIREASLLVMKEKCGRYTLLREPFYLDRCIVCTEADWDEYFELQEISSKETFIFKAEDGIRTRQWYTQLQYHAQGLGAWRKRRNALANIMINGMLSRT